MRVSVLRAEELTPEHVHLWSRLQRGEPRFASPYLCPELSLIAAEVRPGVRIGVLEEDREIVGFLPFHCDGEGEGGPVVGHICDLQAVVVAPGARWDPRELIRGCGLRAWSFDGLLADQEELRPYHEATWPSRYMDLTAGYDAYIAQRRRGSGTIKRMEARGRKIEHEIGPLRFAPRVLDAAALHWLIARKSAQVQRAGADLFAPWVVAFCEKLQRALTPGFSGLLSVLEAGGEPVAAHLGMCSHRELHYWFPVYDPRFRRYSPGLLLLLRLAAYAAERGLERIHIGGGDHRYKDELMSGAIELARGRVGARGHG